MTLHTSICPDVGQSVCQHESDAERDCRVVERKGSDSAQFPTKRNSDWKFLDAPGELDVPRDGALDALGNDVAEELANTTSTKARS